MTTVDVAKSIHAARHASAGADPVTAAAIGAAAAIHASRHASAGADPVTPAAIGAATTSHKSTHAISGSDLLTPADIGAALATRTITAGTGLTGGGDLTANRTLTVAYGSSGTTAAVGNDARLSDARTPTAHKTTHATGGTDVLVAADVGAAAAIHASRHASAGADPVTPAAIGAATTAHHATHSTGGTDAIAPADIGAATTSHHATHATGGTDPLDPNSIGAVLITDLETVATSGDAADLSGGLLPIANVSAGLVAYVLFNGTTWPSPPTARSDILRIWIGGNTIADDPTTLMTNGDIWLHKAF